MSIWFYKTSSIMKFHRVFTYLSVTITISSSHCIRNDERIINTSMRFLYIYVRHDFFIYLRYFFRLLLRYNKSYKSAVQSFKYRRNFVCNEEGDLQRLKYFTFVAGNNENALRRSYY